MTLREEMKLEQHPEREAIKPDWTTHNSSGTDAPERVNASGRPEQPERDAEQAVQRRLKDGYVEYRGIIYQVVPAAHWDGEHLRCECAAYHLYEIPGGLLMAGDCYENG